MSDTTDLNTLFQQAVTGYDEAFLSAESAITAEGEAAGKFLADKIAEKDLPPFTVFTATALAEGISGKAKLFQDAMKDVANYADFAAKTPLGTPPSDTAAGTIVAYSTELSDLVALHMVKETQWPYWKTLAAIIYLGYYADASVLPALNQFIQDMEAGKHAPEVANKAASDNLLEAARNVLIVIEADANTTV